MMMLKILTAKGAKVWRKDDLSPSFLAKCFDLSRKICKHRGTEIQRHRVFLLSDDSILLSCRYSNLAPDDAAMNQHLCALCAKPLRPLRLNLKDDNFSGVTNNLKQFCLWTWINN
jgi:hypothetical protein